LEGSPAAAAGGALWTLPFALAAGLQRESYRNENSTREWLTEDLPILLFAGSMCVLLVGTFIAGVLGLL